MSELAQVQIGSIFHDLRARLTTMQENILRDARPILRREYATSVHQRFFRTGAGLQSTREEFYGEGDVRGYRLVPTAFYMIFGEYGTGRRGAATGQPSPAGYRYGDKPGMAARRFGRIALSIAKPQITNAARARVRQLAANVAVN